MIKIITSGLYTSLQDKGRFGSRNLGVPVSGAMDLASASLANSVLGNNENEVVLEITMLGPTLFFENECVICITGATFKPLLNGAEISMFQGVRVPPKSTLKLGAASSGVRGYIAVKGGFDVEKVLGSYSQFKGVTSYYQLKKGAELSLKQGSANDEYISEEKGMNQLSTEIYLNVTKGPEFDVLSKKDQYRLLDFKGIVAPQSNRMAYLLGIIKDCHPTEIITSTVQPGTVQVTPAGKCIVLMRDAQTTGGYARLLQLTSESMDFLSQKRPLQDVFFRLILE